ncbi:AaceriAFR421Cp [[Ashbya] aceris (nom. inval.)]|nr:AaceriAFR421Cp [[Ashbya] aceris (nom. inval.)]
MSCEDDWLDASDDEEKHNDSGYRSLELQKLERTHRNRGYRDGISSAKEDNLQEGFDMKFPEGSRLGFQVGELIGKLQALHSLFGGQDSELRSDFKEALAQLQISRVLTHANFNEQMDATEALSSLLAKWDGVVAKYTSRYIQST